MRHLPALILTLMLISPAAAQAPAVEFLGQKFEKKYEGGEPNNASKFVEFGLPPEDIKKWTRLVAYRHYPRLNLDTRTAAVNHGKLVKNRDKDARMEIITNDKTGEAIIDFLMGENDLIEFNVIKYTKAPGGGLVSTQFAVRFRLGEMQAEELVKIRTAAPWQNSTSSRRLPISD
jgi:hypothetical protein